ncbi:hypothetical protein ABI59_14890 [Acidobacteria bacterium Mor1]|nr:hypothetical protein ABI59_14890 [Acidobacteria bacterium Mor1]
MHVNIKICGITSESARDAAVEAGADAIGFVFAEGSPRDIAPDRAAELARELPPFVTSVAVFRRPSRDEVAQVLECFPADIVQLDAESMADCSGLGARLLPVFHDSPQFDESLTGYEINQQINHLLFESALSGQGAQADWERAGRLAQRFPHLVLAGGLDPDNVAQAIRRVRPCAVDVSSGVESSRGVKDNARIQAFVAAVRATELRLEEVGE